MERNSMLKKCTKCEEEKELSNFQKAKRTKDGLQHHCKQCRKKYDMDNKDKRKIYSKEYYLKNKEKSKTWFQQYYLKNKIKRIASSKLYSVNNRNKVLQSHREYYLKNKDISSFKIKQREYVKKNKDKIRIRKNKWLNNKRKTDVKYRISWLLRERLRNAIKGKSKKGSAVQLLGCSLEFFKEYIATKFKKGMTWENHGKWHIDHIQPLASFDLENQRQLAIVCHYTNLQPLWAKENLRKHSKITQPYQLSLEI